MARRKEFDPEEVLGRAVELFRARGYEASSTNALIEHMGIGRGSLYETFGTKSALFDEAIRRYELSAFGGLIARLEASSDPLETIRRFFAAIGAGHANGNVHGCLMVNTTVELARHDEATARFISAAWKRLEAALVGALERARGSGDLSASKDPLAIARFLVMTMRGMGVGAKLSPGREEIDDVLSVVLSILD